MKGLLSLVFSLFSVVVFAQETTTSIKGFYVDFQDNAPAELTIVSPKELVEKSRGLKNTGKKFMEIEGIVKDQQGVKKLSLNEALVDVSSDGYFVTNVPLVMGENNLVFSIMDQEDNKTDTLIQVVRFQEEIATPDGGKYYALLIGIDDYQDPYFIDLDNPIKDTKKLYDVLVNDYAFNAERVTMKLDATRDQIIEALDELTQVVTPTDNVLIFYAGHGLWDDEAEIGYWLPSNAQEGKKSAWFRNSTLRDYIKEIRSKHTLLIADACFSGSIFKSRSALAGADAATTKMHKLPSRKAMTSGTLTAVPDRSVFIKFLISRLEENEQSYLSAGQLFASFKIAVMNNSEATPRFGTVQNAGDEGGDFIFIKRPE